MTDYGDPLSAPFWAAASEHRLVLQHCVACGTWQHYPRPFCVRCDGEVTWREASGSGTIYSQTTVHLPVSPHLPPPYVVALVELVEGPRLLTYVLDGGTAIGDSVRVHWLERDEAPPLPMAAPA